MTGGVGDGWAVIKRPILSSDDRLTFFAVFRNEQAES